MGAVRAALASLDRPVLLLLGGRDKEGGFAELIPDLNERVRSVVPSGRVTARRRVQDRHLEDLHLEGAQGLGQRLMDLMRPARRGEALKGLDALGGSRSFSLRHQYVPIGCP